MKPNGKEIENRTVRSVLCVFSMHQYLVDFFFEKPNKVKIRFRPDEMRWRIQDMSSGEQVLVRVALDIWSGSGDAKIWELLEILDEGNFGAVLKALMLIKFDRTWPYDHGSSI